jgi:hypothetical protein
MVFAHFLLQRNPLCGTGVGSLQFGNFAEAQLPFSSKNWFDYSPQAIIYTGRTTLPCVSVNIRVDGWRHDDQVASGILQPDKIQSK